MKPLERSDEVFRFLVSRREVDGDGETDLIALFTYALVEQDRIQWADHRAGQGLLAPTDGDTRAWFADKPETYFDDKERRSEQWFADFARAYLKEEIARDREHAVQNAVSGLRTDILGARDTIVKRIDRRTRSRGWSVNIASGLISNFVFALVVAVLFFTTVNKLSFGDVIGDIAKGRVEAKPDNGK